MSARLAFERYLDLVGSEAARIAAVSVDLSDHTVPSCPEWNLHDLAEHLWRVYTFFHAQVLRGDAGARVDLGERKLPDSADPGERLEEAAHELVGLLSAEGADKTCWNWSGTNLTTGWVARRMALESAVHRYDAELAAESPTSIASDLAVDGIDEFLTVHLTTDLPEYPEATLGGPLCLACSDTDDAWTVEIGAGKLRVRGGRGPAAAYLSGTASDLFLFVWNRVSADCLDLSGDRSVADAWAALPH